MVFWKRDQLNDLFHLGIESAVSKKVFYLWGDLIIKKELLVIHTLILPEKIAPVMVEIQFSAQLTSAWHIVGITVVVWLGVDLQSGIGQDDGW